MLALAQDKITFGDALSARLVMVKSEKSARPPAAALPTLRASG